MAAKRYLEESHQEDEPIEKRARKDLPPLALYADFLNMVIEREFYDQRYATYCCSIRTHAAESGWSWNSFLPVCEEIEEGIQRHSIKLTKSPSLRLEQSSLHLAFSTALSLPIFTDTKICTMDGGPLRILLLDSSNPASLSLRIKLEMVVLDGDFPQGNRDMWTRDEFKGKIVKERTGKPPLLAGERNLLMRDGVVTVGDLEFTDNSSWIRSHKFRIGVRVVPGSGLKIAEGFTEAFIVKDRRGEVNKKHHPPILDDEVWRLEKIGKRGPFDKKLASQGITSVQDFLRLYVTNPTELRKILGVNMSDKIWNVTINHAQKCIMGNKQYMYETPNCSITFNPIFQILNAQIDGRFYSAGDLHGPNKAYVESLAKVAYKNLDSLEVVEGGLVNSGSFLLTQGHHHLGDKDSLMASHQMATMIEKQIPQLVADSPYEMNNMFHSNPHMATTSSKWIGTYEATLFMGETLIENPDSLWAEEELTYPSDYCRSEIYN